ncbi:Transcriptional regulatory protein WalR [BD1-7 clade bacterium]|uniref:Transcriptional regulatory protein WalR n=1 Tax=BD1-7 clade bacterium TaxID=2029982 RepID=A0A5S9PM79_9GAMM|nr:Transcriptional regulatory protein WalR [BD1-7 clade bacterium]
MTAHIVIVDDDIDLTNMIRRFLERHDFSVEVIRTGEGASERIQRIQPDLLILDLMLPGVSGMEICANLRPQFDGPIVMLTALADDVDQIAGLNQGADDYLPKPLKPELLLARIQALLRRHRPSSPPAANASQAYHLPPLSIDPPLQSVTWHGEPLPLSGREYDLLFFLAQHAGQVLARDRLYQAIFQTHYDGIDRSLDVLMSRLRRKVPDGENYIRTIRGQGYLLALEKQDR